jgi:hypothetical protein
MKRARPNDLGLAVEKFFREYLPTLRGMSLHTIRSYRDALILFLRFRLQPQRSATRRSLSRRFYRGACDAVLDVPGGRAPQQHCYA